jgi:hypothetical protein
MRKFEMIKSNWRYGLIVALSTLVVFMSLLSGAWAAQDPYCRPIDDMKAILNSQYSEEEVLRAVDFQGALIQIFGSSRGTWTLLRTVPGQPTCAVAVGDNLELLRALGDPA